MGNDDTRDDWNSFDWGQWGASPDAGNGHTPAHDQQRDEAEHASDGFLRPALADVDEEAETPSRAGHWQTHGGVLSWMPGAADDESEEPPLREEAQSPWAAEDFEIPLGAPATTRLRAVRAWLARRRLRESQLIGELLLERRRLAGPSASDEDEGDASATPERPDDPLTLALNEAQAAADEYETLLGLLEDTRAHIGPQAALVEFYLAITDRLATLATQPAAPEGFAESTLFMQVERQPAADALTPTAQSEWEGRAGATLATRKRVEQVTATEPEDD